MKETLLKEWKEEEASAQMSGWDFSHIDDRYEEDALPWDYREIIQEHLRPHMELLDIDTGGGEFLLSLHHPFEKTSATEGYPPNITYCRQKLLPLGIQFAETDECQMLPFEAESFDMVINRHGSYLPEEIHRVLKPGGLFLTQQVGAENERELVEALFPEPPEIPYPDQYPDIASGQLEAQGFSILQSREAFEKVRFYDIGALVWFAHMIAWEFPGFSVDAFKEQLFALQQKLERDGCIEAKTHRYLIVAKKAE